MPRLTVELADARKQFAVSMLRQDPEIVKDDFNELIAGTLPGGRMSPNMFYDIRNQVIAEKEAARAKRKASASTKKQPTIEQAAKAVEQAATVLAAPEAVQAEAVASAPVETAPVAEPVAVAG